MTQLISRSSGPAIDKYQADTVLGLDVGGTKTRVVFGSLEGRAYSHREFGTMADRPFDDWFAELTLTAESLLADHQSQDLPKPVAVSVSIGGPLNIDSGVIYAPPNLPTWIAIPLRERLIAHFQLPTFLEHDGNAGALAEHYWGAGREADSLVFLTLGTGLGAGILLNGRVLRGATDTAGEVGHMRIAPDGPLLYGKAGAWEGYCSAAGLEMLAQRTPDAFEAPITARQILQAAISGDAAALRMVEEMGAWLGQGMAVLVDVLNPQKIIVGTLGVVLGDLLLEPARAVVNREALPIAAQACQILPAALGDDLGSVASLMAVSHAWREGRFIPKSAGEDPDTLVASALHAGIAVRERTVSHLSGLIASSAQAIVTALQSGGKVLACGNGGSAAVASHFASELIGRFRAERRPLPAVSLTDNGSVLTCISNDYAYEDVFARQVEALAGPGDVVVAFTTSGRSPNVVRALAMARSRGALTIALTGRIGLAEPDGAQYVLQVASDSTASVQEEHEAIVHIWCEVIDRAFS